MSSERVYQEAIKVVDTEAIDLTQYDRFTEMNEESIILALNVDGPDAQTAALLANEIGQYGIYYINSYFTVFEIDFLDQAIATSQPIRPRTYRNLGIAAGIGFAGRPAGSCAAGIDGSSAESIHPALLAGQREFCHYPALT